MKFTWKEVTYRVLLVAGVLLAAAAVANAGDNPQLRPFWGTVSGTVHWEYAQGTCPTQQGWTTVSEGKGKLTHLGNTIFKETHCAGEDGFPLDGLAIFTAKNGDQVWATYVLGTARVVYFDPPLFVQEGSYIISGGTGRFEKASGSFTLTVYATFSSDPVWPTDFVVRGAIAY